MITNIEPVQLPDDAHYRRTVKWLSFLTKGLARTSVHGLENIPVSGKVLIAPNHVSNIDPVLAGVQLAARRPVIALAKRSLFSIPVVGAVLSRMGHIPVDRNSATAGDALRKAEVLLDAGIAVAVYPEGTIPQERDGRLGVFKTGAARLALQTGAQIVPIGQWGAQQVLPPRQPPLKYILNAFFKRPKVVIVIGEPLLVDDSMTLNDINTLLRTQIQSLVEEAQILAS